MLETPVTNARNKKEEKRSGIDAMEETTKKRQKITIGWFGLVLACCMQGTRIQQNTFYSDHPKHIFLRTLYL